MDRKHPLHQFMTLIFHPSITYLFGLKGRSHSTQHRRERLIVRIALDEELHRLIARRIRRLQQPVSGSHQTMQDILRKPGAKGDVEAFDRGWRLQTAGDSHTGIENQIPGVINHKTPSSGFEMALATKGAANRKARFRFGKM